MFRKILTANEFILVPSSDVESDYGWQLITQPYTTNSWKGMFTDKDDFVNDFKSRLEGKSDILWTAYDKRGKKSNRLGMISLSNIAYGLSAQVHGVVDYQYLRQIARPRRPHHKTIVDKIFERVIAFAFDEIGVARLDVYSYGKNPSVRSLARRHGFKQNAYLKKSVYIDGDIQDTFIYGLLEDQHYKGLNNGKQKETKLSGRSHARIGS